MNPGNIVKQIVGVLRKEMLLEWRQRSRISGLFFFALAIVLMVAFASPSETVLKQFTGGVLWVGLLMASTRSLDQSYQVEFEHGAMEGLLLWPVDPVAIYYGKAIANTLILITVALFLLPLLIAIYDSPVQGELSNLLAAVVLGSAAIAAPGTLYGLITAQARGSSVLLPLLLFPLVVPAVLAASKLSTLAFETDPMSQSMSWIKVLVAYNALHWTISGLLYGKILED